MNSMIHRLASACFLRYFDTPTPDTPTHSSSYAPLPRCPAAGFTILEFIIVLVVIGILAASVSYKVFSTTSDISPEVAVDQIVADIRYLQMLATGSLEQASSRTMSFSGSSYNVAGQTRTLPQGVTASGTTIRFNSLGEKLDGATTVTVTSATMTKTITIHEVTGKVDG